ncbi:STAS-like domain-containing protein [Massilia antarctica]|uniref:STAS-like domain-containing protein n=1 Tax=Massilia antarctica TaxID=2765360 RepID=A0AA49AAS0_9BURK|nr:STAS-like domain-containing protein [Massilia antarctica]QPI52938.1 STAS-like domain-containing protein [Massilia antarctica]
METMNFSIAKQYSLTPAGRYLSDGPFSGERFREEILLPALRGGKRISVDLDGAVGFGSSFLEEAFGGLVRAGLHETELRQKLVIKAGMKTYLDRVWRYIKEAQERAGAN